MKKNSHIFILLIFLLFPKSVFSDRSEIIKLNKRNIESVLSVKKFNAVFINVWATWCKPCKEEFPDIIKLYRKYKKFGVKFISISADYPDEIKEKIAPFLKKMKVPFKVYVQNFDKQEELISILDKKWNGALPFTLIVDKKGKKRVFLIGKQEYRVFEKKLQSVL